MLTTRFSGIAAAAAVFVVHLFLSQQLLDFVVVAAGDSNVNDHHLQQQYDHSPDGQRKATSIAQEFVPSDPKIIGGTNVTNRTAYPFFATVGPTARSFCGASLIAPDILLSVAHCFDSFNSSQTATVGAYVRPGFKNTPTDDFVVVVNITEFWVHPSYTPSFKAHDIMMMKIAPPVLTIAPVTLDFFLTTVNNLADINITTMGFGLVHPLGTTGNSFSDVLLQATVREISLEDCEAAFGIGPNYEFQLCVRDVFANVSIPCGGDSGGPLVIQTSTTSVPVQVGLVSFGMKNCDNGPTLCTRVSGFQGFIKEELCRLSDFNNSALDCSKVCFYKQNDVDNCLENNMTSPTAAYSCKVCLEQAMPTATKGGGCGLYQDVIYKAPKRCGCSPCESVIQEHYKCTTGCSTKCAVAGQGKCSKKKRKRSVALSCCDDLLCVKRTSIALSNQESQV